MSPLHEALAAIAVMFGVTLAACDDKDQSGGAEHGHEHGDEHGDEHEHGSAKPTSDDRHDHADAHPPGHDHHAEGHGHGDSPMVGVTLWSEKFELFAEHPVAFVGQPVRFLVHITDLGAFKALGHASLSLELNGPATLRAEASAQVRGGIYSFSVTPPKPGVYIGRVVVNAAGAGAGGGGGDGGGAAGAIDGLELTVFPDAAKAASAAPREDDEGLIEFLKEQQWGVPFGTAFVAEGVVVPSIRVAGRVGTPPGGSAEVSAPVTGRIVAPKGGLPNPGAWVKRGQLLALLMPAPSSPEEGARAGLAVAEAMARASAAKAALESAERLIKDEAISQRALEDAQREAGVAREAVTAAKQAQALHTSARTSSGVGGWRLTAPISGTLAAVDAKPGATVSPSDVLFRIVDTKELWISAKVPEQDAARMRTDRDASFRIAGLNEWQPIAIGGDEATASVIAVGRTVDPVSRTVDVVYSLGTDSGERFPKLRVGGLVDVVLPAGQDWVGPVVPRAALIDQDGRSVVYIQETGEHFSERLVQTGARAGDQIAIEGGLRPGERIVVKGANLVRLAERAKAGGGHGHIH